MLFVYRNSWKKALVYIKSTNLIADFYSSHANAAASRRWIKCVKALYSENQHTVSPPCNWYEYCWSWVKYWRHRFRPLIHVACSLGCNFSMCGATVPVFFCRICPIVIDCEFGLSEVGVISSQLRSPPYSTAYYSRLWATRCLRMNDRNTMGWSSVWARAAESSSTLSWFTWTDSEFCG